MSLREQIIAEIDSYIEASGMTATNFGLEVMNDRAFVHRLRKGRRLYPETADHIRHWMRDHPLDRKRKKAAEQRSAA